VYSKKTEYYDLPIKYDQTRLKLLVQSPNSLYAYWDISDDTINFFCINNGNYSEAKPLLRVSNITKNYSYDFNIDPYANNYYITITDTNCKYKIELIRKIKNKVINITSSNEVIAPRDHVTNEYDEAIFRNYICLGDYKRIKLYKPKLNSKQDYTDFENCFDAPSSHSHISSGERMF
jgi:hypothetical protein